MATVTNVATTAARTGWLGQLRTRSRRLKLPWISVSIVATLCVFAAFAQWLAPHDPLEINMIDSKMAPAVTASVQELLGKEAPLYDWNHPLGTDVLGRDMLSRLIYGARTSVLISLVALGTGMVAGTVLGLMAGYRGGWVDALIMRAADAALGFPTILVAMIIFVVAGQGIWSIVLAVMLTVWARFARMIRGDVLGIKELDFITLARIAGVSAPVIIARHVFPNIVNTLMVITSLQIGQVILLEASLSFLGLGLPPGHPAWGIMVSEGKAVITDVWWLSLLPGISITVVVLAFNFFGDWLRDTLDPKLRRI
ncbi:MAG TPA: ABC transporter permease [Dehalococcoidia bacterium]|nr:ABC transporter permease [Dehalococcoidia bacterium]